MQRLLLAAATTLALASGASAQTLQERNMSLALALDIARETVAAVFRPRLNSSSARRTHANPSVGERRVAS